MISYFCQLIDDAGSPVGDYILFITLVKQSPQSDWLIAEFGSGP